MVTVTATDDAGVSPDPVTLALDARETMHFNSNDLEMNDRDRLSGSVGIPTRGYWRLRISTDLDDVEALAYVRTTDGFLTSMHDRVPGRDVDGTMMHHVRVFNPGSNANQQSMLRLVNPTGDDASVTITGLDDAGSLGEADVGLTLPAGQAMMLSAADLEAEASDRSDRMRVVALALLSGFVWKPIWSSSQSMLMGQEKKSPIDSPAHEAPSSPTDEPLAESPYEALIQFIDRFIDERTMEESEFQRIVELPVGNIQEVRDDELRFTIDEGPLVIRTQAQGVDLVGTLYQYGDGALEFIEIDDDSGTSFNPKFDIGRVEGGDYLLTLKPFEEDALYDGPVSVLVSQD